jgi:glycosyltransferase involved in cell wall biosynthesis
METTNKKTIVIIPAYNEQNRIADVVNSVVNNFPQTHVLVINDASQDCTVEEALKEGAEIISHPVNLGYGSSIETGYLYALRRGYDIVVQMDGDGQHVASEINKILVPVQSGEADLAIGSRYMGDNAVNIYKTSFLRRLGQIFFGLVLRLISGKKFTDPTSGFMCLNRKCLNLFLQSTFPDDFPDADVLLIAYYAGITMKEVPVTMKNRSSGKSIHDGMKPFYYVMKMTLSIIMVILNHRRWTRL